MSTVPQSVSEGAGHEHKDADVPSIFLVGLALLMLILLVQLIVWMTLRHLRLERAEKEKANPRATARGNIFPEPRLQIDPAADLAQMRARDSRELDACRWIDRKAGTVRIPIERAMELLAERGLPDVGQNQTPLSLMQARPGAKSTPPPHRTRY